MKLIKRIAHSVINSFVYGFVHIAMRVFYKIFKI